MRELIFLRRRVISVRQSSRLPPRQINHATAANWAAAGLEVGEGLDKLFQATCPRGLSFFHDPCLCVNNVVSLPEHRAG